MGNKKLIVGVFGTANTGKSTMISDIVEASKDREDETLRWTLFGDDYRTIITEKGLKINRNGNEECQQIIHDTLLGNIKNAVDEMKLKRIIMDRTVIDSFSYTYWHYRYGSGGIKRETLEKMWMQTVKYSKMFDELLYIPLSECKDVAVVDDKFRDTDTEYRTQIDGIMHSIWLILASNNCNMSVISGTRERRVDTFLNVQEYLMEHDGCRDRNSSLNCFENTLIDTENKR